MNQLLRKRACREQNLFTFLMVHQRHWRHVPGTGARELARLWHRVRRSAALAERPAALARPLMRSATPAS